jgi:transcriptional regulator CtsR
MSNLADMIEKYIRAMLESANEDTLELQRNELALLFDCVPSQINYVLSTRFTTDRGYVVESRRGGGGYIRIIKLRFSPQDTLLQMIQEVVGNTASQKDSDNILSRLEDDDILAHQDIARIKMILLKEIQGAPEEWRDVLRARILRALLGYVLGGD